MSKSTTFVADHVDRDRQWDLLMKIASFGAREDGGVDRPALSQHDVNARNYLIDWAESRGSKRFRTGPPICTFGLKAETPICLRCSLVRIWIASHRWQV